MSDNFYTIEELTQIGFAFLGTNDDCKMDIRVSRKASIYSPEKVTLGNHVRIDDFCILSGHIEIGNYVHIAAYTALYGGKEGIYISDFANLSSRICVYSVSDDYSGKTMTNPMVPDEFKDVESRPVYIGKHVIIGSTSIVLPGVNVAEGSSFGSFSFINSDSEPWSINVGIPARKIKNRSRNVIKLERDMLEKYGK